MMYGTERLSDRLLTPRSSIAEQNPEIIREQLLDSQALMAAIASYNTTAKTHDDSVLAATDIAQIVRDTVSDNQMDQRIALLSPQNIAESERADCYGQTIILSECLERAEIAHYLYFVNRHAFVLLGDETERRYAIVDPIIGKYNGDITPVISGKDILEQFAAGDPSATVILNTKKLLQYRQLHDMIVELTTRNRWISHESKLTEKSSDPPDSSYTLFMKVFPPKLGHEVLWRYANTRALLAAGESDNVTEMIRHFGSTYPDVDPHNRLAMARAARTLAFKQKKWGNALIVASVIEENAHAIGIAYAQYFIADTLKKIGNCTGIDQLMEDAIDRYEAIPHSNTLKRAKIKKTTEQRNRMK